MFPAREVPLSLGGGRLKRHRIELRYFDVCVFILGFLLTAGKAGVKGGSTSSVSNVALISPPMTTVANGLCTSAPVSVASAIGTKPSDATIAVMATGRRRIIAPSNMASRTGRPSSTNCLMKVSITSPLRTATPERAMNPTAAGTENGIPRSHSATIPPVKASGTALNTSSASRGEPSA